MAWSGLAGVQAFRDPSGGGKLLGLAEALHRGVDVGPVDSTGSKLSREGSRAAHRPSPAHERARERLVVEVAELLETPERGADLLALIAPPGELQQQLDP